MQIMLVGELWIMVTNNHQSLVLIFFMPFPQRGNGVSVVNSTIVPDPAVLPDRVNLPGGVVNRC
jgi:hypothetical protein